MVVVMGHTPIKENNIRFAIETMRLSITEIHFILGTIFRGMPGAPMNKLTPMESFPEVAR